MIKNKMLEDLRRSGLTKTDADKLGYTPKNTKQLKTPKGRESPGYVIPYYDIRGKDTGFYRVRLLQKEVRGFCKNKKPQRYTQPRNEIPRLYFPPTLDWAAITKDTAQPLIITEGEKKAAKGCKCGLATIGLGGVWSWRCTKSNLPTIPDFEEIDFDGRETYLVFDSDLKTNPHVHAALVALCRALTDMGAIPYIIFLPDKIGGEKQGLDDFLLEHTLEDFYALPMDPFDQARALFEMNQEFIVTRNPAAVFDSVTCEFISPSIFTGLICADKKFTVKVETPKGEKLKTINTATAWLKWPGRRFCRSVTFEPGSPEIIDQDLNIWTPPDIEPRQPEPGELDPYFAVRDHIFSKEPQFIKWFEQWAAYPIAHPGTKLYTAVLIHGIRHGTGKSLLGYTIGKLYGKYFKKIGHKQLYSDFNQWAKETQFVLGDEISGTDKRAESDMLKNLVTSEEVEINTKGVRQYYFPDYINYFLTSNHPDAAYIENDDRRLFILEVVGGPLPDSLYEKYDAWLRSETGIEALLWYYLNEVDLAGFNPRAGAPKTESRVEMIGCSMSDLDQFVAAIVEAPDAVLGVDGAPAVGELWTATELLTVYDVNAPRGKRAALGKALRRAGIRQYHISHKGLRLYAIKKRSYWDAATNTERAAHYEKTRGEEMYKKFQ